MTSRVAALEEGGTNPNTPTVVTYTADDTTIFNNPRRGFMLTMENSPGATPTMAHVAAGEAAALQAAGFTGGHQVMLSKTYIYLKGAGADAAIPAQDLTDIATNFANIAADGRTTNVRFAYQSNSAGTPPPFSRILLHIAQLVPVINTWKHVINSWQAGFIGHWGENHFAGGGPTNAPSGWTDPAANASGSGTQRPQFLQVLQAMLAADSDVVISVRYPHFLRDWIASQLTTAQLNRIGFFNDGFMNSQTYVAFGTQSRDHNGTFLGEWAHTVADYTDPTRELNQNKQWLQNHIAGHYQRVYEAESDIDNGWNGSTNTEPWDDDYALADSKIHNYDDGFERYQADDLRFWGGSGPDYRTLVLDSAPSIRDDVLRRLGYRLQLVSGSFPNEATSGGVYTFTLTIRNKGFAPMRKPFVPFLKPGSGTAVQCTPTPILPLIGPGQTVDVTFQCTLPALSAGSYPLSLEIRDPYYASTNMNQAANRVRLANSGTWDSTNARNNLLHSVTVA